MRAAFDASAIDPITPAMLPSLVNATDMETEIPEADDQPSFVDYSSSIV
jgi:hypothetical protein